MKNGNEKCNSVVRRNDQTKNKNRRSDFAFNMQKENEKRKLKFEFPYPMAWVNEKRNWKFEFRSSNFAFLCRRKTAGLRHGGATTHDFLGAQPKIQSDVRPVGRYL